MEMERGMDPDLEVEGQAHSIPFPQLLLECPI